MAHWILQRKENKWTLPHSILPICRGNSAEIRVYQIPPAGEDPAALIHWYRHPLACSWCRKSFPWLCQQHLLSFPFGFLTLISLFSSLLGSSWMWGQVLELLLGSTLLRLEALGCDALSHGGSVYLQHLLWQSSVVSTDSALLSDSCPIHLYI